MKFKSFSLFILLALVAVVAGSIFNTDAMASVVHGLSAQDALFPALFLGMAVPQFPTLLEVAKLDKGSGYDVIQEAIHSHAEIDLFPASTQSETTLDVTVLKSLPGGSTFRRPNEGVLPTKSAFENKRFDMSLVDRRVEIDRDGVYARAKDKARFLVNQSKPQMEQALSDIAVQIIYGKLNDTNKGFPGLIAQAANDAQHVVDVTGTASKSSVWFLDINPASMELVFGADQSLTMEDEWTEETVFLGEDNARMKALTNRIFGWVGLRLLNINRVVRIKNIGVVENKTLTAEHMNTALNLCQDDLGFRPTHILGNGRSFEQLRLSLATDLLPDPKRLNDFDGIPLVRSINISKSEA